MEEVENSLNPPPDHYHPSLSGKATNSATKKSSSAENTDQGSSDSGSGEITSQASNASQFSNYQSQVSHSQDSPVNHVQIQASSSELSTVENHASGHASNVHTGHSETRGPQQMIQTSGQASMSNSLALNAVPITQMKTPQRLTP